MSETNSEEREGPSTEMQDVKYPGKQQGVVVFVAFP
jgi:hypothetical protein